MRTIREKQFPSSSRIKMRVNAIITMVLMVAAAEAAEPAKRLFILSGQSNMTAPLKDGFVRVMEERYGKENVTVVHQCQSGRGLRFWDKDYKFPDNYRFPGKETAPEEKHLNQHGTLYGELIQAAGEAAEGKTHDTVTFIWMQGESDAGRALGEVYGESFLRLLGRMKADLGRKDIGFVIGRISDAGLKGELAEQWERVRAAQVKLAEDAADGDWIDTDDLNGPNDDVHYPGDKYPDLGARFAAKAIELIEKSAPAGAKGSK
jgi:hypothetical protein